MHELTREQESAIARLAVDYSSVTVTPQESGAVKATAGGRERLIDTDGGEVPVPVTEAVLRLPVSSLRHLLGDEVVDAALVKTKDAAYPDHALGWELDSLVRQAIDALMRRWWGAAA